MYAVITSSGKPFRPSRWSDTSAGCGCPHFVGNFPRNSAGCCGCGLYAVTPAQNRCACFMGPRPPVAPRIRQTVSGGNWYAAPYHYGRPVPRHGCVVGDGGRIAMPRAGRCHRRGLGRSARARFYGDQTPCHAIRGGVRALLADPSRRRHKPECCTRSLACSIAPVCAQPPRRASPRIAALGPRSVPLASAQTGVMGGRI